MKNCLSKSQASLLAGIFLLLTSCGAPRATPTPETFAGNANSVVISTFTATPISSAVPQETSTPAPDSNVIGQLPGLSPVNVTVSLEQQKFTCTAMKKVGRYYERTCIKGLSSENLFQVVISGRESFLVDLIQTSVRQNKEPDPKIAVELLGFMATMPYDGATPDDAKAWVESGISTLSDRPGEAQEAVFGGVKYVLQGPPAALTLEMGELL